MATVFTQIIQGEIPGRFIHRDDRCAAFLTIAPLAPGHTLVVPILEIDHWLDLEIDLMMHLTSVAQRVGQAIDDVWRPRKVGLMIAGLEVPHVHIHVSAINTPTDLDFARVRTDVPAAELDDAADRLRKAMTS